MNRITSREEKAQSARIPLSIFLVLVLGSRLGQAGWLIIGVAFLGFAFRDQPDKGFSTGSIPLLASIGAVLVWSGIVKGLGYADLLKKGRVFDGRVLKIDEDNSGDSTTYRVTVEYRDDLGKPKLFYRERDQDDLVVAQPLRLFVDPQSDHGLLAQDIPGGLSISDFIELKRAPLLALLRVLTIPLCSFAPLISFFPSFVALEPKTSVFISDPFIYSLFPMFSMAWLFINARYFPYTKLWDDRWKRRVCPLDGTSRHQLLFLG